MLNVSLDKWWIVYYLPLDNWNQPYLFTWITWFKKLQDCKDCSILYYCNDALFMWVHVLWLEVAQYLILARNYWKRTFGKYHIDIKTLAFFNSLTCLSWMLIDPPLSLSLSRKLIFIICVLTLSILYSGVALELIGQLITFSWRKWIWLLHVSGDIFWG